jgi:YD repeat-containing protein
MDEEAFEIDDLLKVSVSNEDTTTRVESVIQDPDNFNTVVGNSSTARFTLPQKGNVLAPNGRLLFKAVWNNFANGTDTMVSFPRLGGALACIKEARLFCGSLIERNKFAGQKINLENAGMPYDAQNEVLDVLLGSNHGYTYNAAGELQFTDDIQNGSQGCRALTATTNGTNEFSVPIDSLFSCLKDVMLPTFLRDPIIIEIDFDLTFAGGANDVVVASGAAALGGGNTLTVVRPRLDLDYLVINEEMVDALRSRVMMGAGLAYTFRNNSLVQKTLPAVTVEPSTQENDLEIGFAGTKVMKMYIQKRLSYDNTVLKQMRSDGLLGEALQVFVNNQNLYDRDVERVSDFYVYLGQAMGTSSKQLNGTYELVGAMAQNNPWDADAVLPADAGGKGAIATVQEQLQGRLRYLGVNFGQARDQNNDVPTNALQIGQAPIVIRLSRTLPANGGTNTKGEVSDAKDIASCAVNVFAEVVKVMSIQNGSIQVSNA